MARKKKESVEPNLDDSGLQASNCLDIAKRANKMADELSQTATTPDEMLKAVNLAFESFRMAANVINFAEQDNIEEAFNSGFDMGYDEGFEDGISDEDNLDDDVDNS